MEFLLYLTPIGNEIIDKIISLNYKIKENASICKNKDIFGAFVSPNFIICTKNIKNSISPINYYVNETVYHEAVHIIHSCKNGPIKLDNAKLDSQKINDVVRSIGITKQSRIYEFEAYYLEDKPNEVNSYLKKFCF